MDRILPVQLRDRLRCVLGSRRNRVRTMHTIVHGRVQPVWDRVQQVRGRVSFKREQERTRAHRGLHKVVLEWRNCDVSGQHSCWRVSGRSWCLCDLPDAD